MDDDFRETMVALLPRLRRFAFALSHSMDHADDLVQTACEKALARRSQFQPGSRMDSWMYRIIQNAWFDRQRASGERGHTSDEFIIDSLPSNDRSMEALEAARELEAVHRCMQDMPAEQRVVIALVTIEGNSYKDAAEILDLPIGTVMSRLSRARRHIVAALPRTS
jgi:RNA polymerase sigma-70 factor (ECF subfamily)